MAREGASIVINDVVADSANKVVSELKADGAKAVPCIEGVGTKETAEKLVAMAVTCHPSRSPRRRYGQRINPAAESTKSPCSPISNS